jgi:hypothetical protein
VKLIKTLSLAAVAAMAAMAFLGASSASAAPEHPEIVLCQNAELICETPYPNPTEIHGETKTGVPAKLLTKELGTVECEHSLAIITLLNKLAKLIEGHLLALNFTGKCLREGTECTVTVNALGGLSITPGEKKLTAIVKAIELEGRKTNATVKCGTFINCTYSAGAVTELEAHSDAEGHLLLLSNAKLVEGKGFLCPTESTWDATYHAVNLDKELTLKTGLYIEL